VGWLAVTGRLAGRPPLGRPGIMMLKVEAEVRAHWQWALRLARPDSQWAVASAYGEARWLWRARPKAGLG
jgi:hypothetical protein